ncbi:PilE-like protein [Elusimicrobium minutum Pei191]|uniref:PilE-like protein n=1 Tax=Elusimicrobium minutum (strain Pei191) TaxID=445932 RepID=B2KBM6_ELUMP|nr:prepilin-type N-terminal cleavage/methylation domain-containing protein [Elusimicrobium minutum]ACC97713.1 PilE-like protein [Elusimicrobium minutum Pei191]
MIKMKRGFTLIELLVVVVIIGILAAIAYPMYAKAIERNRSIEAMVVLKRFKDMQSISSAVSPEKVIRSLNKAKSEFADAVAITSNTGNLSAYPDGQVRINNYDYIFSNEPNSLLADNIIAIKNTGKFKGYALFIKNGIHYCMDNESIGGDLACEEVFGGEPDGTHGGWIIYKLH